MTTEEKTTFRRLVLDLCTSTPDADALRLAGELARLLRLDLQGLFVEDPAVSLLAALPGAREFRLPGPGWERLDPDRIATESRRVIARAERLLTDISAAAGVAGGFETRRGHLAEIIEDAAPTDILFIAEPRRPAERLGEAFLQCCRAAHRSAASILLVPAARPRAHGPVVVVAAAAQDPSLTVAARIAQRAGETLILLADPAMQHTMREQALASGLRPEQILTRLLPQMDATSVARALTGTQPRLLVLMRSTVLGEDLDGLLRLASQSNAPVLAVEPITDPG